MSRGSWLSSMIVAAVLASPGSAEEKSSLQSVLDKEIIGPHQAMLDVQDFTEARVLRMPDIKTAAEWEKYAQQLRTDMLDKIIFRGEAKTWRAEISRGMAGDDQRRPRISHKETPL